MKLLFLLLCLLSVGPMLAQASTDALETPNDSSVAPPATPTDQYKREHLGALDYVDQKLAADNLIDQMTTFASDTRSPRATLESFFYLADSYYTLINADGVTWDNEDDLDNIANELADLFDMDDIPENFQAEAAIEATVYMCEYLSRRGLPPLSEIPDEDEMAKAVREGRLGVYRIPDTPIEIARINHGDLEGHYLFVNTTLDDALDLYNQAANYPYLRDQFKGFYDLYFLTSGPMIPSRFIRALPDWMSTDIYEQTIWQWILTLMTFAVMFGLIYLVHIAIKRFTKDMGPLAVNAYSLIRPLVAIGLTKAMIYFLDEQVFLTGEAWQLIVTLSDIIVLAANITIIVVVGNLIAELALKSEKMYVDSHRIDQYLIRLGIRILSIVIAIGVLIQGLQALGFSGNTLLAGASVSGLAVALAAQSTLKNVFGSIMLVLDKPFVIGERIITGGVDGLVEEIGLRSTRIRTLDGHLVSIPNDELSSAEIENVGRRPYIKRLFNVGVTYSTSPEKIAEGMRIIEDLLAHHETQPTEADEQKLEEAKQEAADADAQAAEANNEDVPPSNAPINYPDFAPRVFFDKMNADSLNIMVLYWYHPADYMEYLKHATWVNSEILRRFNAAGIEFAFPTQTIMLQNTKATLDEKPT
ncbi:mechanosensitive ion channel family protein [Cerasicoccus frondis]|uniref:mechanosensitive ion channel family protein n=1 Tax=Cerasicoccus frondis TaxID=490090 RepID=UPI0028524929|nr:mechanosensitive ion channel family protein [Cerasicoccus frondis]